MGWIPLYTAQYSHEKNIGQKQYSYTSAELCYGEYFYAKELLF